MPSLIDILIVLSGVSAAQAGPMRRYANTTLQISHTLTAGVAYNPVANVPALSLAPVQGITTLPFSLIAEAATESANVPVTTTTGVQSFKYEPLSDITTTPTQHKPADAPTSFWTFGDGNRKSTVTLTSTSIVYEYAQPSSQAAGQPAGLQSSHQNASPGNGTTTPCSESTSQTSVLTHNPIPTNNATTIQTTFALPGSTDNIPSSSTTQPSSSSPTTAPSTTSSLPPQETQQPTTSEFAYPYPSDSPPTTSAIAQNNDNTNPSASTALSMFSSDGSNDLPEVVMEGSQSKQNQYDGDLATTASTTALSSSSLPGITIVPAHPSVIYITVTDPGVTTTVTA